jgi:large repetitive protein
MRRRRRWISPVRAGLGLTILLLVAGLLWPRDRDRRGNRPASATATSRASSLAEAAGAAPAVAASPPESPRAVEGVVVDTAGAPVAGAEVLLTGLPATVSAEGGRFRFADVAPGAYHLSAHAGDAAAGPLPVEVDATSPFLTVRLLPGVSLAVEVVDVRDGRPIPSARGILGLRNSLGAAGELQAHAGDDGVLRFPAAGIATYHIAASAEGYAPATRWLVVGDRRGLAWRARIALEPGVVVEGRVVDAGGRPVAGAEVTARPAPRATTHAPYRPRPPDPMRPPAVTDDDGRFRYPVPAGQALILRARHRAHAEGTSAPVVAARPIFVTIEVGAGRALTGRVVDTTGRPVAGAQVTDAEGEGRPLHVASSDADGRFALPGIDARRRQVLLRAEAGGARSRPVLVALPAAFDAPIEIVLADDLHIAGTVVDAAGVPVADAVVTYRRDGDPDVRPDPRPVAVLEPILAGETRADGDGRFSITGLAPGEYQLAAASVALARDQATPQLSGQTIAAAGDEDVSVAFAASARIRGRVLGPDGRPPASAQLTLRMLSPPIAVAADGTFDIADINPGISIYTVDIDAPGAMTATRDAAVRAGETTDLGTIALAPGRLLTGRVLENTGAGPVAGALVTAAGPDGAHVAAGRSDELGHFSFAVPDGPLVVHAAMGGVGGSEFQRVSSGADSIELRLPQTGRLVVTVEEVAPERRLSVAARRIDPEDGGLRAFVLERTSGGTPTFQGDVSPGEYLVTLGLDGNLGLNAAAARAASSEARVTVEAGRSHALRITPIQRASR